MTINALKKAIKLVGGQSKLARKCNELSNGKFKIRQQHVYNWLNRAKKVPAEYVLLIEKATKNKVKRSELRPDIYPPEEDDDLQN